MQSTPHTAVLMTGGFRTFDKIFPQVYKNVLSINNCVLFILCETDTPTQLFEILNGYPDIKIGAIIHAPSFRDKQYNAIVQMIESSDRPGLSQTVYARASATDGLNWEQIGPGFIKSSGSIIQYYQVWKLWQHVLEYERTHNMQFTHCMRTRCDITFSQPIYIHDEFVSHNSWYTAHQLDTSLSRYHHTTHEITHHPNDYVITFCVDLVWIARRRVFDKLSQIIFHYGLWDSGHPFSFNSESTFHEFCTHYNIHHYGITEAHFPLYTHSMEDAEKHIMIIVRS